MPNFLLCIVCLRSPRESQLNVNYPRYTLSLKDCRMYTFPSGSTETPFYRVLVLSRCPMWDDGLRFACPVCLCIFGGGL